MDRNDYFSGTDQAELPGQDNTSPQGEGAYEEIPLWESIAPWDAGLLADPRGEERTEEEEEEHIARELEHYKEGKIGKSLCYICAVFPCICTTRRVEERIKEVRKSLSELASQEEKEEESRQIMKKRKRSR